MDWKKHNTLPRFAAAVTALLMTLSVAVEAQTRVYREGGCWIEETQGDIAAGRGIRVRADLGSINVDGSGSDPGKVHYVVRKRISAGTEEQARRIFESYRFNATRSGEENVFVGDVPSREWRRGSVQITISAPRQQDLVKISTRGGDVHVSHINGRADIETGGGNVGVDDIGQGVGISSSGGNVHIGSVNGELKLRSGGGNVDVGNVGQSASLSTGGGNIGVNVVHGDLMAETGGGNINVKTVTGGIKASTGGGSLDLGDIGGQVAAETGGGSIRLRSGGGVIAETGAGMIQCYNVKRGLKASTGSGGITVEFVGKKGDFTNSHLEAGIGDIVVYLPNDLGVRIEANIDFANGHEIQSDFSGLQITQSNGFGPRQVSAEGSLNGGGPTLELHTTTGNIMLRRAKKIVSGDGY